MNRPLRVAVTGAAGQIGYSLLFRIASGEMLGREQPVVLQLLEIPDEKAQKALRGVMMELDDCAFPLLSGMVPTADPMVAFRDADVALLVGARPRGPGMERKDLLEANGKIFGPQGKALSEVASRDVKFLVVGNPANTNCLIAMKNAPQLKPANFTAMMRLDHNRALSQVAQKTGKPVAGVRKMTVWGNHSATQYPDIFQAEVEGQKVWPMINDQAWLEKHFIPTFRNAARPSSKPAACRRRRARPMQRSTMSGTGCLVPATATGSAWASPPMAVTALPKAFFTAIRACAATAGMKSSKACNSAISAAPACRPRSRNCTRRGTRSSTCCRSER